MRKIQEELPEAPFELGARLVESVDIIVGDRLIYPDERGEFKALESQLPTIGEIAVTEDAYTTEAQRLEAEMAVSGAKERLSRHSSMVSNVGKVLIPATGGESPFEWTQIPRQHSDRFSAVLLDTGERVEAVIGAGLEDRVVITRETKTEIEEDFDDEVRAILFEIQDTVPEAHYQEELPGLTGRLAMKLLRLKAEAPHYPAELLAEDLGLPLKVSRKVRKLNDLMGNLLESPEGLIVARYMAHRQEDLEAKGAEIVDGEVSGRNAEIVSELPKGKSIHFPRANRTTMHDPVPSAEDPTITEELAVITREKVVERIDGLIVTLPWMQDGEPTRVEASKMIGLAEDVLIVRAIRSGKLTDTSETSRRKSPTTKDEPNVFDTITDKMATRIAEGINPRRRMSGIKRSPVQPDSPYHGSPIWFPTDVSANARTIYFTVRDAEQIADPETLERLGLDPKTKAMLVLGETDKASQLQTLAAITGKSRRGLRSAGAGAI
jgi:hypothetical protein